MKLTMFGAMGLGVALASLFLLWLELSLTFKGQGVFAETVWFTALSLTAIALFVAVVLRAPDND